MDNKEKSGLFKSEFIICLLALALVSTALFMGKVTGEQFMIIIAPLINVYVIGRSAVKGMIARGTKNGGS